MSRQKFHTLCILLLALTSYLIGNERVSLWDRDEPRYAQASRQMLASGDWVVPRLYDTVRTAKPVLIYWCQAACMSIFGDRAAAARLPSAIAMTCTLAILAWAIPGRRGFWTVVILASSLLVFWSAKSALTDAVLLLFVTITQLCLYLLWRGNRSWITVMVMATAIGLGGLTKGPAVLLFPVMTVIALACMPLIDPCLKLIAKSWRAARRWYENRRRSNAGLSNLPSTPENNPPVPLQYESQRFRPRKTEPIGSIQTVAMFLVGLLIVCAVVGPWLYLIERRSPGFIAHAIGKEVIDRAKNPQEGHAGPPGYYFFTIWVMFFPWSLFLPAALITAWRNRRLPQVRFALAAVIGPWIVLELIRTKLPHYLLPAYPFLAFITADFLVRVGRRRINIIYERGFLRVVGIWAVIVAIIGIAPWIASIWFSFNRTAFFGLMIATVLTAEYARNVYVAMRAGKPLIAAGVMGVGMFILVIVLHVGFLPAADFLQVSRQTADILKLNGASLPANEIMIDYKEPSLAFYQEGTIREESRDDYLSTVDPIFWPQWIVVTDAVLKKMPAANKHLLEEIGSVRGWDYAGKGIVNVKVLKRAPSQLGP